MLIVPENGELARDNPSLGDEIVAGSSLRFSFLWRRLQTRCRQTHRCRGRVPTHLPSDM